MNEQFLERIFITSYPLRKKKTRSVCSVMTMFHYYISVMLLRAREFLNSVGFEQVKLQVLRASSEKIFSSHKPRVSLST